GGHAGPRLPRLSASGGEGWRPSLATAPDPARPTFGATGGLPSLPRRSRHDAGTANAAHASLRPAPTNLTDALQAWRRPRPGLGRPGRPRHALGPVPARLRTGKPHRPVRFRGRSRHPRRCRTGGSLGRRPASLIPPRRAMFATRFAPSPTGRLHKGHAFSALTAWRAAKDVGG